MLLQKFSSREAQQMIHSALGWAVRALWLGVLLGGAAVVRCAWRWGRGGAAGWLKQWPGPSGGRWWRPSGGVSRLWRATTTWTSVTRLTIIVRRGGPSTGPAVTASRHSQPSR
eukprot:COSAG01_NODE_11576_length_1901_cov_5.704218_2_plen_113_part_00